MRVSASRCSVSAVRPRRISASFSLRRRARCSAASALTIAAESAEISSFFASRSAVASFFSSSSAASEAGRRDRSSSAGLSRRSTACLSASASPSGCRRSRQLRCFCSSSSNSRSQALLSAFKSSCRPAKRSVWKIFRKIFCRSSVLASSSFKNSPCEIIAVCKNCSRFNPSMSSSFSLTSFTLVLTLPSGSHSSASASCWVSPLPRFAGRR